MGAQSSKPLYAAAAVYACAFLWHYAAHGADMTLRLPPPGRYDLRRDAGEDLATGLAEARRTKRNLLIMVGGDWCPPCEQLDKFLRDDEGLTEMIDAHYVLVRVAVPQVGLNIPALRALPIPEGYPHFYVIDGSGRVLSSQETDDFGPDDTYDRTKLAQYFYRYEPAAPLSVAVSTAAP